MLITCDSIWEDCGVRVGFKFGFGFGQEMGFSSINTEPGQGLVDVLTTPICMVMVATAVPNVNLESVAYPQSFVYTLTLSSLH